MKALGLILLCAAACAPAEQKINLKSQNVLLPSGDVIGVAFEEPDDEFVVQQIVVSTENNGLIIRLSRFISSWSISTLSNLAERDFGLTAQGASSYPCGRVASVAKRHWVVLCSAESFLEALDVKTLATAQMFGYRAGQYIYDFVIDEQRDKVFVVSLREDQSTRLTSYSLSNGSLQEEATVTVPKDTESFKLALEAQSGQVILAATYLKGCWAGERSRVYVCGSASLFSCVDRDDIEPISQMDQLGRQQLLFVMRRNAATDKTDCINSINLTTKLVVREYCAPSTGVRYALGIVSGKFIVGFTGTDKLRVLQEARVAVQNSFVIWRVEDRQAAATVSDPSVYLPFQSSVRVVASRTIPAFLTFSQGSSTMYLHTISDAK